MVVPSPTALEKLMVNPDYQGGIWMMVDIDTGKLKTKSVRLNVSLPEGLLRRIDNEAKSRHMSRSAFLAMSAQRELGAKQGPVVRQAGNTDKERSLIMTNRGRCTR